ncbi:hypothetical protein PVL29_025607 [Vitis rotundifolia]|uniref:Fe2OG dioxygenase domain-containing protein n=1 Tax=Vitis rotundifolia TaxID=103349 RepID=A0AA38YKE1_VITRO|nr:hypothetical protein PVL29_025607 [Vitis rotundifolia]
MDEIVEPPFKEFCKHLSGNCVDEVESGTAFQKFFAVDELDLPLVGLNLVNLGPLESEECKRQICDAASNWGFLQLVNQGISLDIVSRLRSEQVKLFRQPFNKKANEKLLNLPSGSYRWEHKLQALSCNFHGLKPFTYPLSTIDEFAVKVFEMGQQIAQILAENLSGKSTFCSENCLPSSCFLRMNRYPPCLVSSNVFGIVPHIDSDFLTILHQDEVGRLQIIKDGKWIGVKLNPEALIINIGNLFQAWSNGIYNSVEHLVLNHQKVERFSIAYFFCSLADAVIQSYREPSIYRSFSFREYQKQVQEDAKSTGNKVGLSRSYR